MPNGSVLTATSLTGRTPRFRIGSQCSRCRRHLIYRHRPVADEAGTWSHESCDVDTPTNAEFQALAEELVGRSTTLRDEWAAISSDARVLQVKAHFMQSGMALTDVEAVDVSGAEESLFERQADFHDRLNRMVSTRTRELRAEWAAAWRAPSRPQARTMSR